MQPGDIDEFGHTNNVRYLQWLERVAWAHSISLGLSMDDYRRLGCGVVARKHELEYLAPTFLGEELQLGTWVRENDGRLSMWRAYQIVRSRDGKTVLFRRVEYNYKKTARKIRRIKRLPNALGMRLALGL